MFFALNYALLIALEYTEDGFKQTWLPLLNQDQMTPPKIYFMKWELRKQ